MKIQLTDLIKNIGKFRIKQKIFLSGEIYTVRDSAHKKIIEKLICKDKIKLKLKNLAIYYCGPTPTKPGYIIGSCGPTTSSRMDNFTPILLRNGVKVLIGKGDRSDSVVKSIKKNKSIYLIATGGVGALISTYVENVSLVDFRSLESEAIYKLNVINFPLIVAIDCFGNNIFKLNNMM
jgi:fumarate hydratase subunit beta